MRLTKALWSLYAPTALFQWLVICDKQEHLNIAWLPAHVSRLVVDGNSKVDGQKPQLQKYYSSDVSCLGKEPTIGVNRVLFPTERAALRFNWSPHEAINEHGPKSTSKYEWSANLYFTDIRGLEIADRDSIVVPGDNWDWNGVGDVDGPHCSPVLGPTLTVISTNKQNDTKYTLPMSCLEGLEASLAIEITGRRPQAFAIDSLLPNDEVITVRQCTFIRFSSSHKKDRNTRCRFNRSHISIEPRLVPPVHSSPVRDPHTNIAILITLASVLGVTVIVSAIYCALRRMRRTTNTRVEEGEVYDARRRRLDAACARECGCKTPKTPPLVYAHGPPPSYEASQG